MAKDFNISMMKEYEMTDLGLMRYFLGIQINQSNGSIFISQEKYVKDLLKRFHMMNCKYVATPMALNEKLTKSDGASKANASQFQSLLGSLIYLTNTRPDIVHAVSVIPRFMSDPSQLHFFAAKKVMRYVNGTKNFGLHYVKEEDNSLIGYTDSDWAGSIDDRKSTSGYVFCLGTKPITWSSKKQSTIALSSAKAKYISATTAACEAIWLRKFLKDVKQGQKSATVIYCDNMSAIAMTKNPIFHSRSKHIELRHHFIRKLVEDKEIELQFCTTDDQLADIFTKSISAQKFSYFREVLKITN